MEKKTNRIHFAAIDIGSNAIRLVVKGVDKSRADVAAPLEQELLVRFPLRLGEEAFTKGKISKEKIRQLVCLMRSFREMMKLFHIVAYKAFGTSAMRDVSNGERIARRIRKQTGIDIEIINGETEASIIYETHVERTLGQNRDYLYMDVGGGSTQISLIHFGELAYSHSFNIGTVRMLNHIVPQGEKKLFLEKTTELHRQYPNLRLIGSGGNIIKINRLLQNNSQKDVLGTAALEALHQTLAPLKVEERMEKYKLKRDRAEVIVPAASLFLEAARILEVPDIIVPSISPVDGIVNNLFANYMTKK